MARVNGECEDHEMDMPRVQWGSGSAIRAKAVRGFGLLAVGILIVLAIPVVLALDVTESVSGGALVGVVLVAALGVAAGVIGFRSGLAIRSTYWLELQPQGLELWRGSSRQPVDLIPWISIAAVQVTTEPQPALWIRREPRQAPVPGSMLSEVGRLPAVTGSPDWDLGITLDPASGDPRNLERELAARAQR
jgi:hypothetical protein